MHAHIPWIDRTGAAAQLAMQAGIDVAADQIVWLAPPSQRNDLTRSVLAFMVAHSLMGKVCGWGIPMSWLNRHKRLLMGAVSHRQGDHTRYSVSVQLVRSQGSVIEN